MRSSARNVDGQLKASLTGGGGAASSSSCSGSLVSDSTRATTDREVERPQITYALIVRGRDVVLAEHTRISGNFQQATLQILGRLDPIEDWTSYLYGEYAFHCVHDASSGLSFVCMADPKMLRRIPFAFLSNLQESFLARYPREKTATAEEYEMHTQFRGELQTLMDKWNAPGADRLTAMMQKVQHINDSLMESIDKILERQEKIDILVKSSELLSQSSSSFVREANTLRRVMWWRNAKTLALIGGICLLAVLVLVMAGCGFTFKHC
eukprot:TRINITY_DN29767_c0_g1_i1.p1 TRINITY_DN29767_c0_g1~~TRINITY_DN29767_c0_g1_i1.p1  ORF type:complete len:267 (+),score=71.23 TRINITY_DN29767_c0_g1_i1:112-912(+)